MSREQRLEAAEAMVRDPEVRVPVTAICKALDVARPTILRRLAPARLPVRRRTPEQELKNADILANCQGLRREHPFWGYRRIWVHLKRRQGHTVSRNRVYRITKQRVKS